MDISIKAQPAPVKPASANTAGHLLSIPLFVFATALASLSIMIGLIWDISWHTSIGRDGLFSPPHLGMYLGAVVSGFFSGYQVLKTSFWGRTAEKQRSVKFWGIFYGSLGALFCIWGCFAMLTSAPFDDWWHNTYGLDVTILSPPHTVLLLGMIMVQFGAMISVLALQNQPHVMSLTGKQSLKRQKILQSIFVITSGFFLTMLFTIVSEYQGRLSMHYGKFYMVAGAVYPVLLVAVAKSSSLKWPATATSAVYSLMLMLMAWLLPLFPAEPLLGPILNDITHYQAFQFPLLLIIPAVAIDLIMQRSETLNPWLVALMIGPIFVLLLLAVQWPFGDFLMSPYARNWFFAQESWYFGNDPDWEFRFKFIPRLETTGWALVKAIGMASGTAVLSSRLGWQWGCWMKKVRR